MPDLAADQRAFSEGSELAHRIKTSFRTSSMGTGRYRTRSEIEAMLAGLELLDPGLVELDQWWHDGPPIDDPRWWNG